MGLIIVIQLLPLLSALILVRSLSLYYIVALPYTACLFTATSSALILVKSLFLYCIVALLLYSLFIYCYQQYLNSRKVFISLLRSSFTFIWPVCLYSAFCIYTFIICILLVAIQLLIEERLGEIISTSYILLILISLMR